MVNNVVVFQGVEVTLPTEASFSHRDGVLEVDMSHGFHGRLLLRQASSHQIAASKVESLRPLLPARPAALGDEEVLVQDSLDGQGNQNQLPAGPPALPTTGRAYWFNTSPKATQDLPRVTQDLPAPSAAARSRQEVLLLSPPPVQENSCGAAPPDEAPQCGPEQGQQEPAAPAQVVPASGMPGPEEAPGACGDAPVPEEEAGRCRAQGLPTLEAASAPPGASPSPMVPPPGKENESMQTPAAVKVKGSKDKRASGGAAPGSKSAKRQRGSASPSKDYSFRWKHVEAAKPGAGGAGEDVAPAARWGASLTALSAGKGCLYGGSGREGPRGDAWLFDAERGAWEPAPQSDFGGFDGAAKAWHAATMLETVEGQQLVVFGGERADPAPPQADGAGAAPEQAAGEDDEEPDEEPVEPIADVCALDAEALFWVSLPMDGMDGCKQVPARAGPSLTALPDGRGLVFGGLDAEGKYRNDAFVLDARRLSWFSLAGIMKGAPPKPRAYHTATLVGQRIIVVGGMGSKVWSCKEVYSLQLNSWKWTEHTPEVEGDVPSPRSGHSAVALPDGRHLLLFGGGDLKRDLFHSGCALLDTHTWRWRSPRIQGVARPSGRAGHAVAILRVAGNKDVLLVHGGRTKDHKLCRDTWLLELS